MVVKPKLSALNVKFHHEEPELFVTSQWARSAKKTTHFLVFRLLLGALYIGIISWSWSNSIRSPSSFGYWWIYMTSWGIFVCTISTVYSAVLTALYHFGLIKLTLHSVSYKVYWLLSSTSTVLAFMITVVYWSILFNGISIHDLGKNALITLTFLRYNVRHRRNDSRREFGRNANRAFGCTSSSLFRTCRLPAWTWRDLDNLLGSLLLRRWNGCSRKHLHLRCALVEKSRKSFARRCRRLCAVIFLVRFRLDHLQIATKDA